MKLDREKLFEIFGMIGERLKEPATICLIGSAPAILEGQPNRQTNDIDIWGPASDFATGEFAQACKEIGVLYNPMGAIEPDDIYIQVVRPQIVTMPDPVDTEEIARFGNLRIIMASPPTIAASKLTRAEERDLNDVVWWLRSRNIQMSEIETAIARLPRPLDRETAFENILIVELILGKSS